MVKCDSSWSHAANHGSRMIISPALPPNIWNPLKGCEALAQRCSMDTKHFSLPSSSIDSYSFLHLVKKTLWHKQSWYWKTSFCQVHHKSEQEADGYIAPGSCHCLQVFLWLRSKSLLGTSSTCMIYTGLGANATPASSTVLSCSGVRISNCKTL